MRITDELSENAWASQQLGENEIEILCTMEEIVLETLEIAMCTVRGGKGQEKIVVTEVVIGKRKRNPQERNLYLNKRRPLINFTISTSRR